MCSRFGRGWWRTTARWATTTRVAFLGARAHPIHHAGAEASSGPLSDAGVGTVGAVEASPFPGRAVFGA